MLNKMINWFYKKLYATNFNQNDLAEIEYHGIGGITSSCIEAVARLIQYGDKITKARLLTYIGDHSGVHCFLLDVNDIDLVAIKSGFSSGYGGEGPAGLSTVLQLLLRHGVKIEEFNVDMELINRLDSSCLLQMDIDHIRNSSYVRPIRYYDYIRGEYLDDKYDHLKGVFPFAIPFRIIDERIIDLAIKLNDEPDMALLTGYRRLEDIIRKRLNNTDLYGAKLFSRAFQSDDSPLTWLEIEPAEAKGRGALFTAIFMSYRNPRAHVETEICEKVALREFLLLNELYILESTAVERESVASQV